MNHKQELRRGLWAAPKQGVRSEARTGGDLGRHPKDEKGEGYD